MTRNEIWLPYGGRLVRLDLSEDTQLLPSFAANDRTKPESIENDYAPEFSANGTAHNHALLRHAAASQQTSGQAYARLPCVLISDGIETLPVAMLLIKGYEDGRYLLQITGGNRRLADQLKDNDGKEKLLSDLDFSRFNHIWNPANITARLGRDYWAANGWGYSLEERGKPLDVDNLDPYVLYPCVSGQLIWSQILTDAGFTADDMTGEPLFAQLALPTATPYTFPQKFRDARALTAGMATYFSTNPRGIAHDSEFQPERLPLDYTARAPYRAPTAGASYSSSVYTVDTLGYYDLVGSVFVHFYCDPLFPGNVSCRVMLYINGQPVYDGGGNWIGKDESGHLNDSQDITFSPKLERWLLHPGDTVELFWQGEEWNTFGISPSDPKWEVGYRGTIYDLPDGRRLDTQVKLSVTLREEFPRGGLIQLQEWLPTGMTQLQFLKTYMLLGGLTIQTDAYRPHLSLATGNQLLANVPNAKDWSAKLDLAAPLGRLPERSLTFRFGSYAQQNFLKWTEDENVTPGFGDGQINVADELLPTTNELATLPFAASEPSPVAAGLLRILNYSKEIGATDYTAITARPRLALRPLTPTATVQVLNDPDNPGAGKTSVATTFTYFSSVALSLELSSTVLTRYWQDLRAMLDESRYLVERFRLTAQDVATLDYSVPVWVAAFNDFFAVSKVVEFSPRRSTEVHLARVNGKRLPAPSVPGDGAEYYLPEFAIETGEFG